MKLHRMNGRTTTRKTHRKASRKVNRKSHRKSHRKVHCKVHRKMRGGNTPSETYRSPLFVNMTNKYGADIGQGPALI